MFSRSKKRILVLAPALSLGFSWTGPADARSQLNSLGRWDDRLAVGPMIGGGMTVSGLQVSGVVAGGFGFSRIDKSGRWRLAVDTFDLNVQGGYEFGDNAGFATLGAGLGASRLTLGANVGFAVASETALIGGPELIFRIRVGPDRKYDRRLTSSGFRPILVRGRSHNELRISALGTFSSNQEVLGNRFELRLMFLYDP